jgi:hypothetical protein
MKWVWKGAWHNMIVDATLFFSVKFEKNNYTIINFIGNITEFIFYIGDRRPYVIFFFPFWKINFFLEYFKRFFIFLHSKNKSLKKKK